MLPLLRGPGLADYASIVRVTFITSTSGTMYMGVSVEPGHKGATLFTGEARA